MMFENYCKQAIEAFAHIFGIFEVFYKGETPRAAAIAQQRTPGAMLLDNQTTLNSLTGTTSRKKFLRHQP